MIGFRFFISPFLLSAFRGERLGEFASGKDAATAANAAVYAALPARGPRPRRQARRHAHQRQQAIARRGTEELAPAFNRPG